MKNVMCFSGLPGTGKSTISKIVVQKTGGILLDLDIYKRQVVDPNVVSNSIDPPEIRWQYYSLAIEGIKVLPHEVIIVDEVFHLNYLRTKFENSCISNDMRIIWVEVICAMNVVKTRLETPRPGHILSPSEAIAMNRMFAEIFEPFSGEMSNYIQLDNSGNENIDVLASQVLQLVK